MSLLQIAKYVGETTALDGRHPHTTSIGAPSLPTQLVVTRAPPAPRRAIIMHGADCMRAFAAAITQRVFVYSPDHSGFRRREQFRRVPDTASTDREARRFPNLFETGLLGSGSMAHRGLS